MHNAVIERKRCDRKGGSRRKGNIMLKASALTKKMTAAFTAFALAATLAPALAAPSQAEAAEPAQPKAELVLSTQASPALTTQSYASNTVFATAQTIGLNQSVTGTFDYDADGNWENYWYKFQTSGRRATYRVTLDSLSGRTMRCWVVTDHNDWWGATTGYSNFTASTRNYSSKDDCDFNTWYYIGVNHDWAKRYDQYRITVEELPYATDFSVSGLAGNYAYTGYDVCPKPYVSYYGTPLRLNQDYTLSWSNNKNLGTATVTIAGTGRYSGSISKAFNIVKAKNNMTAKHRKATVKVRRSALNKSWSGVTISSNIKVKGAKGSIRYTNVSKAKKARNFDVDYYSGKVRIPRDTKKGIYKMRIKVTDEGTYGFNAKTRIVTYKITVK